MVSFSQLVASRRTRFESAALGLSAVVLACSLAGCSSKARSSPTPTTLPSDQQLVNAGIAAMRAGNNAAAIQDFNAAAARNPLDANAYYDLGVLYQQQGDPTDASSNYEKALLINPKSAVTLYNLGVLYAPTDKAKAESYYRQLLAIQPNNSLGLLNLGLLLIGTGQTTAGKADIASAIKIDPSLASRVPAADRTP